MFKVRVKQWGKQATEKEAAKETAVKEAAEKDDDEEDEDKSWWTSGSSDDDGPIRPIRFPRVKHWFKCPICLNHLYQHKNSFFFHIKYMMVDEFLMPDVVEQHRQLSRLIEGAICDL
jgi:hypothetical protein